MNGHINYQDYLLESLKDPEEAACYLNAALEGGDLEVFLLALRNVIKTRGGMKKISDKLNKSRTSLYKSYSKNGNPYLKNTNEILHSIGFHLAVMPDKQNENVQRKAG